FHAFIQLILTTLGFNVYTELAGSEGRLDLCLELPQKVFLIIELKYCPSQNKLTDAEKDQALAKTAVMVLSEEVVNQSLSQAVQNKLELNEIRNLLSQSPLKPSTKADRDQVLAQAAETALTQEEKENELASAIRKNVSIDEIKQIYRQATSKFSLSNDQIDAILSQSVQQALLDIKERDYHGIVKLKAAKIIDLGLAIYGNGAKIKAAFWP
ncbi:MAG: hypothetical protein LBT47_12365, partial [Deltaproteobacteria bacterium]|nr:hypothetical protein [Deltaproteobacteria bacterium]